MLKSAKQIIKSEHDSISVEMSVNLAKCGLELRDWWIVQEGHQPILEIVIDKPGGGVGIEDCTLGHEQLLQVGNWVEAFDDSVEIRVCSPGSTPPLRSESHFQKAIGLFVRIETWEPVGGRIKFAMRLAGLKNGIVSLCEGTKAFDIPLSLVKRAVADTLHPLSLPDASKKTSKKKPQGDL